MREKAIFLVMLLLVQFALFSQTTPVTSVDVKLNKAAFTATALPFEEPFNIKGDIPENCFRITYSYQPKTRKKWTTFPEGNLGGDEWKKDNGEKFSLYCEGLHPNEPYSFQFNIFRNPVQDDKAKEELKKKLSTHLNFFATAFQNRKITDSDIKKLNDSLNAIFEKHLKIECKVTELRSKCDPDAAYSLDIRKNPLLNPYFENFRTEQELIYEARDEIFSKEGLLETFMSELSGVHGDLLKDVNEVLSGKLKLNPLSKELLQLPFTPSLAEFKNHTLHQGLLILKKLLTPESNLEYFLKGKSKIKNTDLEATEEISYQSIYFLHALLDYLGQGVIKDSAATVLKQRFGSLVTLRTTGTIDRLVLNYRKLELATKTLGNLISTFPDFSNEIVLADALSLETITMADVVSEKTPYLSVEGGLSYSTSFQSALRFTGANFYFSPVNKKTPIFSRLKGWNRVKKMVCFNVAVGNYFGTRPENTFSLLGSGSSQELMLGPGLRLGRVVKLNAHWLLYKSNNANPLSSEKKLEADFLVSVGADVNLLKALGDLGKLLNLTN